MDSKTIMTGTVCIPFTDRKWGKYKLTENQANLLKASARITIIDSPTGSGKTLAILAKFLDQQSNGIIIYPTNELIKDQKRAIRDYLEDLGKPTKLDDYQNPDPKSVGLFSIDGPTLDQMLSEYKARSKGALLNVAFGSQYEKTLILANPDTIYLLARAEYKYGLDLLGRLAQNRFNFFAFDEFHMYSGIALSNLIISFSIIGKLADQVIISTATLPDKRTIEKFAKITQSESEGLIKQIDYNVKNNAECEKSDYRIIRHKTRIELKQNPSDKPILIEESDKQAILSDIEKLYEKYSKEKCQIKVLVIVNSVIFAYDLYLKAMERWGENKVGTVIGLIPKNKRTIKDITIGTSAIEVGIDFDACSLIFEATDSASFIQRLGRISRKRPGEAIAYLNKYYYEAITKKIKEDKISYKELTEAISYFLPQTETHIDFLESPEFAYLLSAFIWRLTGYLLKEGKILRKDRIHQYHKALESFYSWLNKAKLERTLKQIDYILRKGDKFRLYKIIGALERISFRGTTSYIPAIYPTKQTTEIFTVSIRDLNKLEFETITHHDIKENNIKLNTTQKRKLLYLMENMGLDIAIKITNITKNKNIEIKVYDPPKNLFVLEENNFDVIADQTELARNIKKLLTGELAYTTPLRPNWRLTYFKNATPTNEYLVIGADALIAKWLDKKGR